LNVRVLTGSGTYTPTTGTKSVIIKMYGSGAGGSYPPACSSTQVSVGMAGQGGGYLEAYISDITAFVGAPYSVGTAGTAGVSGVPTGGAGGTTTFGNTSSQLKAPGGKSTPAYSTPFANTTTTVLVGSTSVNVPSVDSAVSSVVTVLEAAGTQCTDWVRLNCGGFWDVPAPTVSRGGFCGSRYYVGSASAVTTWVPSSGIPDGTGAGAPGLIWVNPPGGGAGGGNYTGRLGSIIIYEYA
jgi:hypothetical protein